MSDLAATCPHCTGPLERITESAPNTWRAVLIARCTRCRREWQIIAVIAPVARPGQCGTSAGYRRHRRHDEPACDECRQAHARDVQFRAHRGRELAKGAT